MITVLVTAAPSVYLAYRIVDRSIFENNAKAFIQQEINYKNTQVISKNYKYSRKGNEIDLLLLGKELSATQIDSLQKKMPNYRLDHTKLIIRQGLNAKNELDISQIKASILETVYQNDSTIKKGNELNKIDLPIPDLTEELRSLYPDLLNYSINNTIIKNLAYKRSDTVTLATVSFKKPLSKNEKSRLSGWLKNRIGTDSLQLVMLN